MTNDLQRGPRVSHDPPSVVHDSTSDAGSARSAMSLVSVLRERRREVAGLGSAQGLAFDERPPG